MTKTCTACGVTKELEFFYFSTKQGYKSRCRLCTTAYTQKYGKENRGKLRQKAKEYHAKNIEKHRMQATMRRYKISAETYMLQINKNSGLCEVCDKKRGEKQKDWLCFDHDHLTGRLRGLLCSKCNSALGLLGDSIDRIEKLKTYLIKYGVPNET